MDTRLDPDRLARLKREIDMKIDEQTSMTYPLDVIRNMAAPFIDLAVTFTIETLDQHNVPKPPARSIHHIVEHTAIDDAILGSRDKIVCSCTAQTTGSPVFVSDWFARHVQAWVDGSPQGWEDLTGRGPR